MTEQASRPRRGSYRYFLDIATRWQDNDLYGHVNNVVYYSYIDTVVNRYLIDEGGLDIHDGDVVGVVVESQCNYFTPLAYPQALCGGMRVARLGSSSCVYEVAIFAADDDEAAAAGRFVHVFVDRASNRPRPIPAAIRSALARLAGGPA